MKNFIFVLAIMATTFAAYAGEGSTNTSAATAEEKSETPAEEKTETEKTETENKETQN